MADNPIASDLSYEVLQQQHGERKLSPSSLHQPHQRPKATVISGTRHNELVTRLGGRLPLVNLFIDEIRGGSHE